MRATLLPLLGLSLGLSVTACKWTDFDDLADTTWVRSVEDPGLGASDFAVAIAGVSVGTSGGTLVVVSDDTPTLSTIEYKADGSGAAGPSPLKLGNQNFGAIADHPVLATSATGRIALVDRSLSGTSYALLSGAATLPVGRDTMSVNTPVPLVDAAVLLTDEIVFAAGPTFYMVSTTTTTDRNCSAEDDSGTPVQAAAMIADATDLWVWARSGALLRFALTDVAACTGATLTAAESVFTTSLMPTSGARIHLVGAFAVLAGRSATSRTGQAFVVDTADGSAVGSTVVIEGLHTTLVAELGGVTYLVVGVPDQTVGGVVAGRVQLHELDAATGALNATAALVLHDADPESGQQFGRSLATMQFNGNPILVVGATGEIFAYYRTALYDHQP
jgi:hypothetical protein